MAHTGPSWKELAHALRGEIERGDRRAGDRLPTEEALAEGHGVSRMTAHRALSELQASGHVVRRPRAGTFVAERPRRQLAQVAVIMYNAPAYPQQGYLQGLRDVLPEGCRVILCDTRDDAEIEAGWLRRVASDGADAVFCYPTCAPANTSLLQRLHDDGMPLVCVDRLPDGAEVNAFVDDDLGATRAALRILTARGHTRIAHFSDDAPAISTVRERLQGYLEALPPSKRRLTPWLRQFPAGGWNFAQLAQAVYDALFTLRHSAEPPTAVFCAHDSYLAATLAACDAQGLRVPEDLEIVSFNDWPHLPVLRLEDVHRVMPPSRELGRRAALRLAARLAGEAGSPETVRLCGTVLPATWLTPPFLHLASATIPTKEIHASQSIHPH